MFWTLRGSRLVLEKVRPWNDVKAIRTYRGHIGVDPWKLIERTHNKPLFSMVRMFRNTYKHRVRPFSFPGSTPVCPARCSNSFDGGHPGQPPVPCLWSGHLDLRCMPSPREGECDRSISSCQGLTRVSTAGSTQRSLSNNNKGAFV